MPVHTTIAPISMLACSAVGKAAYAPPSCLMMAHGTAGLIQNMTKRDLVKWPAIKPYWTNQRAFSTCMRRDNIAVWPNVPGLGEDLLRKTTPALPGRSAFALAKGSILQTLRSVSEEEPVSPHFNIRRPVHDGRCGYPSALRGDNHTITKTA